MACFSRRFLAVIAAAAIVAVASQVAMAQNEKGRRERDGRGGGRGFGGPITMTQLATIDKVQDALKLKDDQKSKIEKINNDLRDERRKLLEEGRPDFEKMRKMGEDASAKLNEVLDEGQQKRLMGILIQVNPVGALYDPAVSKELSITDEQKEKLRESMRGMRGGRDQGQTSPEERRARMEKMEKDIMAVLNDDQKKKLESLKGEKVDIDLSQFRGRGGRGERGDRPNRDRDKAEEKKAAA